MEAGWETWVSMEQNPYFHVKIQDGMYKTCNQESYYRTKFPDPDFSFDVSNQKVQANIDEFGTVKNLTFFHGNYLMESKPGVWTAKDFVQEHQLSLTIELDGISVPLAENRSSITADLAGNLYPRVTHDLGDCRITLLAAAPVTDQGSLSCLLYCFAVQNTSGRKRCITVHLPPLYNKKYSDTRNVLIELFGEAENRSISRQLDDGQWIYDAVILADPNQYQVLEQIREKSLSGWLEQTKNFFISRLGTLTIEQEPITGMLLERAYMQAYGAFAMSGDGQLLGSSWGTYPVTPHIWNKDMYYSCLPSAFTDPDWCRKCILWFHRYGIKYKGTKFRGGIFHSLSNSLSLILLSGAYYDASGDTAFFKDHAELYADMKKILQTVISSRKEGEPHLYSTTWISDAYALGKYHTGTNICVYRGLRALARIGREVFNQQDYADMLEQEAEYVRHDIEGHMTVEGNWGEQYIEGIQSLEKGEQEWSDTAPYKKEFLDQGLIFLTDVIHEDKICLRMHDGEESDTTLMAYYGYQDFKSEKLHNYGHFAASKDNPTYSPLSKGIKWGNESGATFPGYMSLLLAADSRESWSGKEGYFTELKRLADLDGSWWWWPYKVGAQTGDVVRMNSCGKCGWASGIFVVLLTSCFLGIRFDAVKKTLTVCPCDFMGPFEWKGIRFGNHRFNISLKEQEGEKKLTVTNLNPYTIKLNVQLTSYSEKTEVSSMDTVYIAKKERND